MAKKIAFDYESIKNRVLQKIIEWIGKLNYYE
jgi:hypothetical protein